MMGALVDYWYYTKDDDYVDLTMEGLLAQAGEHDDYMPVAQRLNEGNDDQGFWGLAAMSAAENNFPNPPPDQPQWLALAQAVFNTQAARWDTENCGGGLRWQIFQWNKGWDYKNSISQACFFALGARLALYTGNNTYAEWAERTWDWMIDLKYIDEYWYVYDGAHIPNNCTVIVPWQFTYNSGGFILGAAAMYNLTEDDVWKDRLDNLIQGAKVFFTGPEKNIMTEVACESVNRCNIDQQSFKAYLSRWLAAAILWAPDTHDVIMPLLQSSAIAAAKQCTGGENGRMCGLRWNQDEWDGTTGSGQQMAALEVALACMVQERAAPVTEDSGGTSEGDPGAGTEELGDDEPLEPLGPLGGANAAGAAILTVAILGSLIAAIVWMMLDETSEATALQQVRGIDPKSGPEIASYATATGAAVGGKLRKKGPKEKGRVEANEKGSAEQRSAGVLTPMEVGHVRDQNTTRGSQRLSNMPLGWPHNPSIRGSGAGMGTPDVSGLSLGQVTRSSASVSSMDEKDLAYQHV